MSVSFLLRPNNLTLHASVLQLQGTTQSANLTAPIVVNSDVVCPNLNSELWSGVWGLSGNLTVGDILICSNTITRTFERLPVGVDGSVLTANSLSSLGVSWL